MPGVNLFEHVDSSIGRRALGVVITNVDADALAHLACCCRALRTDARSAPQLVFGPTSALWHTGGGGGGGGRGGGGSSGKDGVLPRRLGADAVLTAIVTRHRPGRLQRLVLFPPPASASTAPWAWTQRDFDDDGDDDDDHDDHEGGGRGAAAAAGGTSAAAAATATATTTTTTTAAGWLAPRTLKFCCDAQHALTCVWVEPRALSPADGVHPPTSNGAGRVGRSGVGQRGGGEGGGVVPVSLSDACKVLATRGGACALIPRAVHRTGLPSNFRGLTSLAVGSAAAMEDAGVRTVLRACPALTALEITGGAPGLTGLRWREPAGPDVSPPPPPRPAEVGALRRLCLARCPRLSTVSLVCPRLAHLAVTDCPRLARVCLRGRTDGAPGAADAAEDLLPAMEAIVLGSFQPTPAPRAGVSSSRSSANRDEWSEEEKEGRETSEAARRGSGEALVGGRSEFGVTGSDLASLVRLCPNLETLSVPASAMVGADAFGPGVGASAGLEAEEGGAAGGAAAAAWWVEALCGHVSPSSSSPPAPLGAKKLKHLALHRPITTAALRSLLTAAAATTTSTTIDGLLPRLESLFVAVELVHPEEARRRRRQHRQRRRERERADSPTFAWAVEAVTEAVTEAHAVADDLVAVAAMCPSLRRLTLVDPPPPPPPPLPPPPLEGLGGDGVEAAAAASEAQSYALARASRELTRGALLASCRIAASREKERDVCIEDDERHSTAAPSRVGRRIGEQEEERGGRGGGGQSPPPREPGSGRCCPTAAVVSKRRPAASCVSIDVAADFSDDSAAAWLGVGDAAWRGGLESALRECDVRAPVKRVE